MYEGVEVKLFEVGSFILWQLRPCKIYYHVHKSPSLDLFRASLIQSMLSQHFSLRCFLIFVPFTLKPLKWYIHVFEINIWVSACVLLVIPILPSLCSFFHPYFSVNNKFNHYLAPEHGFTCSESWLCNMLGTKIKYVRRQQPTKSFVEMYRSVKPW